MDEQNTEQTAEQGTERTPLLAAALDYAARGFQVVPLHSVVFSKGFVADGVTEGRCTCPNADTCESQGKHPRIMAWQNNASSEPDVIKAWWKKWPDANIGVKLGSGSGVVAVDVDPPGGEELLERMSGGELPPTLEMTTGRGRRPLYAIPDGLESEPDTAVLCDDDGKEAVRLQGGTSGAQCVMPPSVHALGKRYRWVDGRSPADVAAAPMPPWLVNLMSPPEQPKWADAGRDPKRSMEGDSFNARADWWEHVLGGTEAKKAGQRGDVQYVTRPGKKGGISATLGFYKAKDGTPALYVFSGNWAGLPARRCYDKFGAYARLHHKGDFSAAGKAAAAAGLSGAGKTGPRPTMGEPGGKGSPGPSSNDDPRGLATTRLDGIDPEPIRWLVPGVIPLGKLVMFAGDGGHGKTTLTLHMTACLTTGKPCFDLDYPAPPPADVLIMSCEDDFSDTVVPRLLAAGADLKRVHRVDGIKVAKGDPTPFNLSQFQKLAEELEDRPDVRFVVIDPAGAYVGASGVDDHKDSELRSLLGPLAQLAAFRKVTILLVKHLNKGVNAKAVHRVGGSTGYVNTVRAAFVIVPEPDNDDRKLFLPLKFNIGKKPSGLAFRLTALESEDSATILGRFPKLEGEDKARLAAQLFKPTWDGVSAFDADAAFGEGDKEKKTSRIQDCREWMIGFMGEYSWPDDELVKAAEAAGFKLGILKRTKKAMREEGELHSKCVGFAKAWWNWIGDKVDRKPNRPAEGEIPADPSEPSEKVY